MYTKRQVDVYAGNLPKGKAQRMTHTLEAIYEDGLLKPLEPLDLAEHTKVRLTVETEEDDEVRAQRVLQLARQRYEGLSEEEKESVEAARLDTARFFASREPIS
jgi:predicted DNA-binding antitoxin AbrB/MazE fold protein